MRRKRHGAGRKNVGITFLAVLPLSAHGTLALVAALGQRLALGGWVAAAGEAGVVGVGAGGTWNTQESSTDTFIGFHSVGEDELGVRGYV